MKTKTAKLLLTLGIGVLSLVSSMACAVYVIQIGNRNSYGVLNLNRLIIRNPNGGTGIELGLFNEGGLANPSYIIKIGQYAGSGALSKIRVSNICDKDGSNCKSIAELSTGTEITGTNGKICVKVDNNTLNCTGVVENSNPTLGRSRTDTIGKVNGTALKVTMPANPHKTGKNIIGTTSAATANANTTNTNTYLNHVEDSNVTSSLRIQGTSGISVSAQNGTLTISGTVGTTTYTADSGLTLASNVFKANLKSYTKSTNAAIDGGTGANRQYAVSLDKDGKLSVNVPREAGSGGDGLTVSGTTNNGYCKYIGGVGGVTLSTPGGGSDGGEGYIQCTDTNAGGGDSLWKSQTVSANGGNQSVLTPNDTSNGLYLKQSVYYDSSLEFWGLNNNGSNRTRQLKLDAKGIRIGESTTTYGYTGVGIGVLGAVGIGTFSNCDSNHLTMFASGNTETGNFEILGNSRLLVGVKNDSYIFFNLGNTVGINTTGTAGSTLNVKGSVKVGNCGKQTGFGSNRHAVCDSSTVGQIRYVDTTNPGQFVGCIKSGTDYDRVSLSYGNNTVSNFTNSSDCTPAIPYNSDIYSQIGINLHQQCSS